MILKKISIFTVIVISVFLSACGSSIKDSQDFTPNKAPLLSSFKAEYIGTDTNYDSGRLYAGMPYAVTIEARDPENKPLDYKITSTQGTFTNQTPTDTGMSCRFYLGQISASEKVIVNLVITDHKNATVSQKIDVGTGKTGPKLTVTTADNQYIKPSGDTSIKFSSDSKGMFHVYCDNTFSSKDLAPLGKEVVLYDDENEEITVPVTGPLSTKSGVQLDNVDKNYVWIVFQDNLSQKAVDMRVVYLDGTSPKVLENQITPAKDEIEISKNPVVTIPFSKALKSPTVNASSILMYAPDSAAVAGSVAYNASNYVVTFTPSVTLASNTKYTVKAASSITDEVDNPLAGDFTFSFTTVPDGLVSRPVFSPPSGTYYTTQNVTLTCSEPGASVVYTIDGTNPLAAQNGDGSYTRTNGIDYTGPFDVSTSITVRALAYKSNMVKSGVTGAAYSIKMPKPVFSFTQSEEQKAADNGAGTLEISGSGSIYFTLDGTDPTDSGAMLLGGGQKIAIYKDMKVRAVAKDTGKTTSDETSQEWKVRTGTPSFSIANDSTCEDNTQLYLNFESGALVYYTSTADGNDPVDPTSANGTMYGWNIPLKGSDTGLVTYKIKAIAYKGGMQTSRASNVMTYYVTKGQVLDVKFSNDGGAYTENISVALTCDTLGADIYYTTDGTVPAIIPANKYSGALSFGNGTMKTVTAIAVKSGMKDSKVCRAAYSVNSKIIAPVISPPEGEITPNNTYATIACPTYGADIYYTIDGSDPLSSATRTQYNASSPIAIKNIAPVTESDGMPRFKVRAVAVKPGMDTSDESTNTYKLKYTPGTALWAATNVSASGHNEFNKCAVDSDGNVYAVGYVTGTGAFNFGGNSSSFNGAYSGKNAVIAKFDYSGKCLWVRTVSTAAAESEYTGVALGSHLESGSTVVDVYAVGSIYSNLTTSSGYVTTRTINFGGSSSALTITWPAANYGTIQQPVLVKYDSDGICQWSKTAYTNYWGSASIHPESYYISAAADASGNVYVAGTAKGTGTTSTNCDYNFDSKTVNNQYCVYFPIIAKYTNSGTCSWVTTVTNSNSAINPSIKLQDISLSSSGICALGRVSANTSLVYFSSISFSNSSNEQPFITALNSDGTFTSITKLGTDNSYYWNSMAVYSSGFYTAGYNSNYAVLRKYSSGTTDWTTPTTSSYSYFNGISVMSDGKVYCSGYIVGLNTFNFGGIIIAGTNGSNSAVLAGYDSSGNCLSATTLTIGPGSSSFSGLSLGSNGQMYAIGYITGTSSYNFGGTSSAIAAGGASVKNAVVVRYQP